MKPIISIIIPTYAGSKNVLGISLESIARQTCPKSFFEVIIADNKGGLPVKKLAEAYGVRLIEITGADRQVQTQRNMGVKAAYGNYVLILDHDEEISPSFIDGFVKLIRDKKEDKDAWYNPFKIIASSNLLTQIRNFEESFYKDTVVAAARIIKKEAFWRTETQFDPELNGGPGEWDLEIQLKLIGVKFGYLNEYISHHEEGLSTGYFFSKKTIYVFGGEVYKRKWRLKNKKMYQDIVVKQYSAGYRLFGIFFEKGKWRKVLAKPHLYLLYLVNKTIIASVYFLYLVQLNIFRYKEMDYKPIK